MNYGKTLAVVAALVLLFSLAMNAASRAQQAPSPELQAAQQALMSELNTSLQLRTALITLQQQLDKANAETKRLTDKYEPKKDDPKK